jgi:hypothetical protein
MHLESPPRHFGDEDTASDGGVMLTSTAAASPRQVDHHPAHIAMVHTGYAPSQMWVTTHACTSSMFFYFFNKVLTNTFKDFQK